MYEVLSCSTWLTFWELTPGVQIKINFFWQETRIRRNNEDLKVKKMQFSETHGKFKVQKILETV